jgi:hypothetical protein
MHVRLLATLAILLATSADAAPTLGGPVSPDRRTKVKINFPVRLRQKNTGGRDGAGLCVFTSIQYSARWQIETPLQDFQSIMRKENGGGWPEKVDQMIEKYAGGVDYLQYEGRDPAVLQAALAGGRLPGVTYSGQDPHYRGWIAHMVNLVHFDDQWACILDNNFIGENELVWMTPGEFMERWRGKGSGWAVILLREPPDPPVQIVPNEKAGPSQDFSTLEPVKYTWYYHRKDPFRIYLYMEDEIVGAYDFKEDYFRFYVAGEDKWLSKTTAPFTPPKIVLHQESGEVGYATDYGIPLHLFPPRGEADERWTRKGKPASKDDLLALLAPGPKPNPLVAAGNQAHLLTAAAILGTLIVVGSLKQKRAA